jgi:hypothetical protein
MTTVSFKQAEVKRAELELPRLHFIVMDQWIDVIGEKAFFAWLKFYTYCDRTNVQDGQDKWREAKIPTSFSKLIKKLGVGNDTFYKKIITPLYNVGLIDIEEYGDSLQKGTKPMNIIVYKYPQNRKELEHAPLEVIRDYETGFSSDTHFSAQKFGKMGGRPSKEKSSQEGLLNEKGGSSQPEGGVFSTRTPGPSESEDNNMFNSFNNPYNYFYKTFNILNNMINSFNSSSSNNEKKKEEKRTNYTYDNEELELAKTIIDPLVIDYLKTLLKYEDQIINDVIVNMHRNNVSIFTAKEMNKQHDYMIDLDKKETIRNWGYFFVNGLVKAMNKPKHKISISPLNRTQNHLIQEPINNDVPFYNWLEQY